MVPVEDLLDIIQRLTKAAVTSAYDLVRARQTGGLPDRVRPALMRGTVC